MPIAGHQEERFDHEDITIAGETIDGRAGRSPKSNVFVFALAFLFCPAVILLHEFGHFAVYYFQGIHAVIYSSEVVGSPDAAQPRISTILRSAGGPSIEAALSIVGFAWLRCRRSRRVDTNATGLDWLATSMALCCGRWVYHTMEMYWELFMIGRSGTSDEVTISNLSGLPGWLLPSVLFLPACWLLVATIKLHPESLRLIPFGAWLLGGAAGALLWVLMVGPAVLGQQPDRFKLFPSAAKPPVVISLEPSDGASNVDPGLAEIRVSFDRPMADNSWAYCGEGAHFPESLERPHYDASRKVWRVRVKLKPEWTYQFALNSDPRNAGFMSEEGVVLAPVYVTFSTRRARGLR